MDFSRHASQLLSSFAPGSSRYVLIGQAVQASVPISGLEAARERMRCRRYRAG